MTLLNDRQIAALAQRGMIRPYEPKLVRLAEHQSMPRRVISYGQSSYGYDLRLSPKEFLLFRHVPGTVMDPKNFNPRNLEPAELQSDHNGDFFILPAHSYGLGVALERLEIPADITCLFIGKSTYARLGLIANLTPGEACLSADTEVLTRKGWKLISDVVIGEHVMCLDAGKAVFQAVEDFHRYYFNGNLLGFFSRYVSQLVTPSHKMWAAIAKRRIYAESSSYPGGRQAGVRRQGQMVYPFSRVEAIDVFQKHNLYLSRDLDWEGIRLGEFVKIGARSFPTNAWLRFLGCWLGDGSAYVQKGGNYIIKLAVVTKKAKREYFRSVLVGLGINYFESKYGLEFRSKDVCEFLRPYKGAKNKRVPREYMQLPPDQLALIREGMMMSDGNIETSTYVSVSRQLVDDFQEMSLKIGDNASFWQSEQQIGSISFVKYSSRFSARKSQPAKVLPENCREVPYSGMVYDLTVPSHVFLIRHENKVSWTGNSWKGHLTLEFSNSSGADCRIYANEGIVQALFFPGEPCQTSYEDRQGKYQNQVEAVTLARV